ncbi:MAG: hypothetical protein FWG51_01460 [Firmicutes bacterium]|nr:hypothetical protein [Bacillota bacterium]
MPTEDLIIIGVTTGTVVIVLVLTLILVFIKRQTRYYNSNGKTIEVFAGWRNNWIKINGEIVDEIKVANDTRGIPPLSYKLDGFDIEVKIGRGFFVNTIHTKIDGKLVQGSKQQL